MTQQIETMKQALKDLRCMASDLGRFENEIPSITAIEKALAQPDQEPVAWISTSPARMIHWTSDKPAYGDDWIPLYTKEQL